MQTQIQKVICLSKAKESAQQDLKMIPIKNNQTKSKYKIYISELPLLYVFQQSHHLVLGSDRGLQEDGQRNSVADHHPPRKIK